MLTKRRIEQSIAVLDEAQRCAEQTGSAFGLAGVAFGRATMARLRDDHDNARRKLDEASDLITPIMVAPQFRAIVAGGYGLLAAKEGNLAQARRHHTKALEQGLASADFPIIGYVLVGCADLSLHEGNTRLAAQLLGAAEAMNGSVDHSIPDRPRVETATRDAFHSGSPRKAARTRTQAPATLSLPRPRLANGHIRLHLQFTRRVRDEKMLPGTNSFGIITLVFWGFLN